MRWIIALVGLAAVGGSLYWAQNIYIFKQTAERTTGIVARLIETRGDNGVQYRPQIRFVTLYGETVYHTSSMSSNPPAYEINEQVAIFYNRDNPKEAKIDAFFSLWGAPLIIGSFGLIFALAGISMAVKKRRKAALKDDLKMTGRTIIADIVGVERQMRQRRRHTGRIRTYGSQVSTGGWMIRAQWQDDMSNKMYSFVSDVIGYDPGPVLERDRMDTIQVRIDPKNPKRYYIDTSFLPEAG